MRHWAAGLLVLCASAAHGDEPFRVMPPGERVLQSAVPGISGLLIVEGAGMEQGGRLDSDLRGRVRLALGGIVLEVRDGQAFSLDATGSGESRLDAGVARRLQLHDFFGIALQTRPVFDEVTLADREGRRWTGRNELGETGEIFRDDRGRLSGFLVESPQAGKVEVHFLAWVRLGDLEVPSRVQTRDASGERTYRITAHREYEMPPPGPQQPARWLDEDALPMAAREALAAERAFALTSRGRGMKAAFLEWLVPEGVVFAPGPVTVGERFASVPTAKEEQPALDWLPEWIVISGDLDRAMISGRWSMVEVGAELPANFGQYLSIWERRAEGWRVVADIGSSQKEDRPLTPRAKGRVLAVRSEAPGEPSAAEIESVLEDRAFREGYRAALHFLAVEDVLALREGVAAALGVPALSVDPALADLAPRIHLHGSSVGTDFVATWGIMDFESPGADPVHQAFLRVWQRGPVRWQITADVARNLP